MLPPNRVNRMLPHLGCMIVVDMKREKPSETDVARTLREQNENYFQSHNESQKDLFTLFVDV